MTDGWRRVCRVDDVPARGARTLRVEATTVALFRIAGDEVLAVEDRCPHRAGPLSQGLVSGDRVVCPLHGWTIGLRDGVAQTPDEGRVATFAVQVRDGYVYLDLKACVADGPSSAVVPAQAGTQCLSRCES